MRKHAKAFALVLLLPFVANADEQKAPKQRQDRPELEVPYILPADRCLMAVYGPELREKYKERIAGWYPPQKQETLDWLYQMRDAGLIKIEFCDSGGAA